MVCNSDVNNIDTDSKMNNPGFGLYTNNNYIPGIGPFNAVQTCQMQKQSQNDRMDSGSKSCIPGSEITLQLPGNRGGIPVQFPPSINNYPGSFTFAVPTQANSILSTFAQSTQPRDNMPCSVGITGAPGIGTHWQHSIPRLMPWQDAMSGQTMNGISTFTGLLPAVSHYEGYCDYLKGSNSSRSRLKRHALDSIKEESPESKIYISEEKMEKRMRELSLNCHSPTSPPHHNYTSSSSSSSSQFVSRSQSPSMLSKRPSPFKLSDFESKRTFSEKIDDGRKRLQEIEDRLELDSSDEENDEEMEPRLHFTVNDEQLLNPNPILPKQLIDDLACKPCLQVMLWKPPGDEIKKIISSETSSSSSSSPNDIFIRDKKEKSSTDDICDETSMSDSQLINSGLGTCIGDSDTWEDDMDL